MMIKRIIKYGILIFIWAAFLLMVIGIASSVFDPTSEDYNDYPLILFVTIFFFPIAYIFHLLLNYFLPTNSAQVSQSFSSLCKSIFEVFVKAVLYFIAAAFAVGHIIHPYDTGTDLIYKVKTALILCLGILFISFIEWWILGTIIGRRYNPLKINENGNATILHIGWLSIFLSVAFATIFFGPIISLLFFYDDNLLVQDELIFAAEMFFDIEIFIFWAIFVCCLFGLTIKLPNSLIYTRFDLKSETVRIFSIKMPGIFFNLLYKLVSYKVITFKQIASVDTWVQEERIFFGHGHSSSHLLKFPTISLSFEPDSQRVDLARGQYLDAEKTKSQIEGILKDWILESIVEI